MGVIGAGGAFADAEDGVRIGAREGGSASGVSGAMRAWGSGDPDA